MIRKNVSRIELQRHLNIRLHNQIGTTNISFGEPTLLAEVDSDGSNWTKSIVMKGNQHDVEFYKYEIESVLYSISNEFNLEII